MVNFEAAIASFKGGGQERVRDFSSQTVFVRREAGLHLYLVFNIFLQLYIERN